jgi:hypothetical protein
MPQKSDQGTDKKITIGSSVVVSAVAATGYEVNRLSTDPVSEKDWPPVLAGTNT